MLNNTSILFLKIPLFMNAWERENNNKKMMKENVYNTIINWEQNKKIAFINETNSKEILFPIHNIRYSNYIMENNK